MNRLIIYIILLSANLSFSQEILDGFILFTPFNNPDSTITTYLVDEAFNEINYWEHENQRPPASMPYLIQGSEPGLENTILVYPYRVPNPTMDSGGVGGGVQLVDWNNNILWDFVLSNEQYQHHHDVEPMPNGNILMIAWERFEQDQWEQMGRASVDNPLNEMWATAILEIEPADALIAISFI